METKIHTPTQTVSVTINGQLVTFEKHRATGAEIKATAIDQGVKIKSDFNLFEIKHDGSLKPVPDGTEVALHKGQEFRAVAPDDNS